MTTTEKERLFKLATLALKVKSTPNTHMLSPNDLKVLFGIGLVSYRLDIGGYYLCPTELYNEWADEFLLGAEAEMFHLAGKALAGGDVTKAEVLELGLAGWIDLVKVNGRWEMQGTDRYNTLLEQYGT